MTGLIYTILSFSNVSTTIALLIAPVPLLSGYPLVLYSTKDELRILLRLVFVCMASEWLDDCIVALITGYRIAMCEGHAAYWISPCELANPESRISAYLYRSYRSVSLCFVAKLA
jgi:hypothetical protein